MTDTPRVDAFVENLPPLEMARPIVEVAEQMRSLMIAWSMLARDLEIENARLRTITPSDGKPINELMESYSQQHHEDFLQEIASRLQVAEKQRDAALRELDRLQVLIAKSLLKVPKD